MAGVLVRALQIVGNFARSPVGKTNRAGVGLAAANAASAAVNVAHNMGKEDVPKNIPAPKRKK